MGFCLNPNFKIIKFDVPTFRVLNEKEEKNPCRTFFLSYSPSSGFVFLQKHVWWFGRENTNASHYIFNFI